MFLIDFEKSDWNYGTKVLTIGQVLEKCNWTIKLEYLVF